jgi:hypothetical protein
LESTAACGEEMKIEVRWEIIEDKMNNMIVHRLMAGKHVLLRIWDEKNEERKDFRFYWIDGNSSYHYHPSLALAKKAVNEWFGVK